MRKWLTAFLVIALLGCNGDDELLDRARAIGTFLCEKAVAGEAAELSDPTAIPDVDSMSTGPLLATRLDELSGELDDFSVEAREGVVPSSIGSDGRNTHYLILRNPQEELLGIRLYYIGDNDAFHILDYWTPS